ncbi:Ras domain-containing protein [Rhizoctonia solani AG-1 IA]|uniref:Ras domain-containing protein n=1 Tax=Thanatephorus cucumeris (strain AG1-IA) TaxID=983506 RepID=L8WJI8_THACA|nr:Ras domain-containing protein [Rhizoctonia solani AG-1 IA]
MLGDGGVGKTALAVQTYDPTIEDAFRHSVIVDDEMTYLEIVDTAGQEEYATLRDQWIREGEGFILVYSIASRRSYDRIKTFQDSIVRVKRGARPVFMLVGNKSDKTGEREVSKEEALTLSQSIPPFPTAHLLMTRSTRPIMGLSIHGNERQNSKHAMATVITVRNLRLRVVVVAVVAARLNDAGGVAPPPLSVLVELTSTSPPPLLMID